MSTSDSVVTMTREELYGQAWTTPMTHLAKKYGLSAAGIVKLCALHNIPRPPSGYWIQLQAGRPPSRVPLPPVQGESGAICLTTSATPEAKATLIFQDPEIAAAYFAECNSEAIWVPRDLRSPHRLVTKTRQSIEKFDGVDDYGRVRPWHREADECLYILVSKSSVPRALRIMDAIVRAAETRGYRFETSGQWRRGVCMVAMGEHFRMRIREPSQQKPHVLTQEEIERKKKYPHSFMSQRREYSPTGRLELELTNDWNSVLATWHDSTRTKLEDHLGEVFQWLLREVDEARVRKAKAAKEKAQEEEARRQREEIERRRLQAKEREKALLRNAAEWKKSREVRDYIEAVRQSANGGNAMMIDDKDMKHWLAWAEEIADRLDPLASGFKKASDLTLSGSPPAVQDGDTPESVHRPTGHEESAPASRWYPGKPHW